MRLGMFVAATPSIYVNFHYIVKYETRDDVTAIIIGRSHLSQPRLTKVVYCVIAYMTSHASIPRYARGALNKK